MKRFPNFAAWRARLPGAKRMYGALLWLYPHAFRRQFGTDMREYFCDCLQAEQRAGRRAMVLFWLRIIVDAFITAFIEHTVALRASVARAFHPQRPGHSGDSMLQSIAYDLRHTTRALRRSPVFTAVALLVIALGTGAVTTIFSAANSLVMRPLPGTTRPSELLDIQRIGKDPTSSLTLSASYPYFVGLRSGTRTLSGIAAWTMAPLTVSRGQEGIASFGNIVSGNYFEVMGVRPALGRFFLPDEDRVPGAQALVVLSHAFWTRSFGGDSSVIGKSVQVNSVPFTVVGVAPRDFHGVYTPINVDVWVPIMMQELMRPGAPLLSAHGAGWLELVGRARPGVTHSAIQAELSSLTQHFAEASEPVFFRRFTGVKISTLFGLPSDAKGAVLAFTALLLGVSALVLLIASANVAGMLLARAGARRREMAVRVALGAARRRIMQQLLTENLLLFVIGGVGGLIVAFLGTRALERMPMPADVPLALNLAPDLRVLLFTFAVSLLTGVTFGLAPALAAARADVSSQLRSDTAGSGTRRSRLRSTLVVGQLALSLLLLVSAGLFVRALDKGLNVNPGFNSTNVSVALFQARTYGYNDVRSRVFYDQLKARLQARPGISVASYAELLPLSGNNSGKAYHIDGYTPRSDEVERGVGVLFSRIDPDYFSALRIPIRQGRAFQTSDDPTATRVAIVNEAFVRAYWPSRDAIGRTFREDSTVFTVVGVVSNSKFARLNEEARPFVYLPIAQEWSDRHHLILRSPLSPAQLSALVRAEVRALDAALPIPEVSTLDAVTSIILLPQRLAASVTGVFGVLGLGLAAVGLYGIVAYSVSQRTREIGVRMALGATAGNVMGMVVRDGMRLVAIGLVIGLVMAIAATRLLSAFLFGVSATDGLTFVFIPLLLASVAALASYLPARRAAATNPLDALRSD